MGGRIKAKRLYKDKLTCGITMGDAAGIGPEVILKALRDKSVQKLANFLIIGNSSVMEQTARKCRIKLNKDVALSDVGETSRLVFGRGTPAYGRLALDCIDEALRLVKAKKIDVLVTAPVNKHTISQTGTFFQGHPVKCCASRGSPVDEVFTGHTEYLARATKTKKFAMMLIGGPLKVVLVTRHVPLKEVAGSLSTEKIYETLALSASYLKQYFGIRRPRIAVCGLNPHSGDEGTLGQEEIKIIRPAVIKAKALASIEGPLPSDTIFYSALQGKFDAVVAMYHDQGLIPLKMQAFHQGVNLTLGLPFVRTSPDHGTAYNIAGKNKANPGSMIEAIKLAVEIGRAG
ncbi:MAG: 4-hydroxythreonine-4-phosphate dehydrogenase PdxA [Candidatus Omnitrophota bacterium]|nr:MAG: 4-hydroxythreonine-4-phosphate dehydrogenase PdxA [Candidatus Omnitrophota bacterium]